MKNLLISMFLSIFLIGCCTSEPEPSSSGGFSGTVIDTPGIMWYQNRIYVPLVSYVHGVRHPDSHVFASDAVKITGEMLSNIEGLISPRKITFWQIENQNCEGRICGFWVDLSPEEPAVMLYTGSPFPLPDTITFGPGDSLYKTLNMNRNESKEFARRFKRKSWEKDGVYVVLVHTGEKVVKNDGEWKFISTQ